MKKKVLRLTLLTLIFLYILLVIGCTTTPPREDPPVSTTKYLVANFIDVGQADCIFVQTPNSKNILIDAGNNEDFYTIDEYLTSQGVNKIDTVLATHPHEDHIGSMAEIINKYNIGQIYMPQVSTTTQTFVDLLTAIQQKGLTVKTAKAGISISLDSDLTMDLLAPNSTTYQDLNDYSAVLSITYKKTSFLFMGDAGSISEQEMVQSGKSLKTDLLKVGHHGSSTSSTYNFLTKAAPKYGIISVGSGNSYGHPSQETLNRLASFDIETYRTDLYGTITAVSDGVNIYIGLYGEYPSGFLPPHATPIITPTPTPTPGVTPSGTTVYITNTGTKYHRYGCRYLSHSCIPISLSQAKAQGYTPCSVCNPPQ